MNSTEVIALAEADAANAIEIARSSTEPVEFITGNSHMPPLRAFGNAERVWASDSNDGGDLFTLYDEVFEKALEAANVYLGCPDYDNSLYVVDMNRWEHADNADDSETLSGEWTPRTAITTCPECGSSDVTSTPGTLPVCRSCDWTGWDVVPGTADEAAIETAAILADPETMAAIAEAEAELDEDECNSCGATDSLHYDVEGGPFCAACLSQEVAVTFTWVVTVLPGQSPGEAVEEYIHSVGFAFDSPDKVEPITNT